MKTSQTEPKFRLLVKSHVAEGTHKGLCSFAEVQDRRGRRFHYSRRIPIQQICEARNPHGQGQCEQWMRKAGVRDAEAVTAFLESIGAIETRAQMNARVAREAIGF